VSYPRPHRFNDADSEGVQLTPDRVAFPLIVAVRGDPPAARRPSIRVPPNRGDTQTGARPNHLAARPRKRRDEPAKATSNAHPRASPLQCRGAGSSCKNQPLQRDRRGMPEVHDPKPGRGRRGSMGHPAWWLKLDRIATHPEGQERRLGSGRSLKPGPRSGVALLPATAGSAPDRT
jgi:hypothetical protein